MRAVDDQTAAPDSAFELLRSIDVVAPLRRDERDARRARPSPTGCVLYGESMVGDGSQPDMYALDAATGKILWSDNAGSSVISGPSIVEGTVYWGAGYTHLGLPAFTGNNKLYAFTLNGQ